MKKQNRKSSLTILLASALAMAAGVSCAQTGGPGGKPGEPPPEALEACNDMSEGDACMFEGRRGESVTGECIVVPKSESLACAPEGGPRPPQ